MSAPDKLAAPGDETRRRYPVVLSIAGSDSGGGAGIQADLKTITALGGFGTSVITALTAQHGAGVLGIQPTPAEFVLLQLRAVREGFPVRAAKTGMLGEAAIIEALADALADKDFPLVVDPVCVSQSGHRLLREDAEATLRDRMLPLADLVTPNRLEAELLTGLPVDSPRGVDRAMSRLFDLGAKAVLIKGGHFKQFESGERIVDWLGLPGRDPEPFMHDRVETGNNHGTGCTLSAALATFLGQGLPLPEAVVKAQDYLTRALRTSFCPGIGAGPPNFLGGVTGRILCEGRQAQRDNDH
jgi:hydroxymethylpyrimidine/phosphomethylpyrimidine kinase